jgi:diaminopimelate decarboxylase
MQPPYHYQGDTLCLEDTPLADVAAAAGTPCYVYSSWDILERYHAYDDSFGAQPRLVCYAVKANSNLSILKLLAEQGSGFDIVSGGELFRVLSAGGDPDKIVFSGVGKTRDEIDWAIRSRIHSFNCESAAELELVESMAARRGVKVRVALRVNPDVEAATHPYISTGLKEHKFGIGIEEAEKLYIRAKGMSSVIPEGVSCHIGSQMLDTRPVMEAVDKLLELVERLRAHEVPIRSIDFGGGLGVQYQPQQSQPDIVAFVKMMCRKVEGKELTVMVEPGRSIVGQAGLLLTRVLYRKMTPQKEFVVVDAAMNDLIRPSLYQSYHEIIPLRRNAFPPIQADVVGPVCESGDFLARDREMANVLPGDYLAVCTSGAYGFVLSSNYNSRPRPAEVLVEGAKFRVIRQRETFEDLTRGE